MCRPQRTAAALKVVSFAQSVVGEIYQAVNFPDTYASRHFYYCTTDYVAYTCSRVTESLINVVK
ncbi:hypothetical protein AGMMS49921_02750 [Endomicrobiia bacterium]|nr:hypothetical protein AGMMS49921_02750 [Endomicrobiia bacterium]